MKAFDGSLTYQPLGSWQEFQKAGPGSRSLGCALEQILAWALSLLSHLSLLLPLSLLSLPEFIPSTHVYSWVQQQAQSGD